MMIKKIIKLVLTKLGLLERIKLILSRNSLRRYAKIKGFKIKVTSDGYSYDVVTRVKPKKIIRIAKKHEVYIYDMINYFDYYFNSVVPKIIMEGELVDYSKPSEHTLKYSNERFYFTSLPESDETTDVYLNKAKICYGNTVLDIGAYCGASAYFFSKAVGPNGRVFSFEPDTENYEALLKNINMHTLKNVTPIKKGIWSCTDKLLFQAEGNMGSGIQSILNRDSSVITIETISLNEAFVCFDMKRVDFIKMDIEGAEIEVLQSSKEFLKKYHPKMIIEPHYREGIMNTEAVVAILQEIGYQYEILLQGSMDFPLIYAY